MIDILNSVLLLALGIPLSYLALLSVLACTARRAPSRPTGRFRRFAVVVPAHNEEASLQATLCSLRALSYPRDLYDIVVVADNCTDRTAEIGRAGGAVVLERSSADERGKGHALRWAFDRLLQESYEGFVVCDADTIASVNLLTEVNRAFDAGAGACQCNDQVKPAPGSWSAEATRAGFLLYNFVRPLGRSVIGCSAGLRGNGMAFAAETLRQIPWSAYSRAEDLEYGLVLLLHGIRVMFVRDALVLATMPTDARNAETQRARWERGRFPVIRLYTWPLLTGAIRQRTYPLADAALDLVTPPFVNTMAGVAILTVCAFGAWTAGLLESPLFPILWSVVGLMGVIHAVLGFAAAGSLHELGTLLRTVPRYAVWKFRLYLRLSAGGDTARWVRTAREAAPVREER